MLIFKVLKRKDGATVVIAIALGFILMNVLSLWSMDLTNKISDTAGIYGSGSFTSGGWKNMYLNPAVSALVQVVILEALLWVWVGLKSFSVSAKKTSKSK